MAGFSNLFGPESAARQLLIWNVAGQLIAAIMAPALTEITGLVNSEVPITPLSPEAAASMVVRHIIDMGKGQDEAAKAGINHERFAEMVKSAGDVPNMGMLVEAFQRGLLGGQEHSGGFPSLPEALKDSTLRPEWHGLIEKLAVQIPTVAEVMNAWLEGQITEDEARRRYLQAGGDPTWFQTSYNANGSAPSPIEAATMANRKIIPWEGLGPNATSYHQAFLEGPWRNKWEPAMRKLAVYLPPARTITAMQRSGALTSAQALDLYEKLGLEPNLAAAYLKDAEHTTSTKEKDLAKGDVIKLYHEHLITEPKAIEMLQALHYSAANAKYILSISSVTKTTSAITGATARVRSLFVGHKITETAASNALHSLGVDPAHSKELLTTWKLEEAVNVKQLTESQIVHAWYLDIIGTPEAMKELQAINYTAYDAWMLLSIRNGKALPNKPAKGANPVGIIP